MIATRSRIKHLFISLVLIIITTASANIAAAQTKTRIKKQAARAQAAAQAASPDKADISFTATVEARELYFEAVPNAKVELTGTIDDRLTRSVAERENLPEPVQPRVTYRNIGVRLVIVSFFPDAESIVKELLGESRIENENVGRDELAEASKIASAAKKKQKRSTGGGKR